MEGFEESLGVFVGNFGVNLVGDFVVEDFVVDFVVKTHALGVAVLGALRMVI